MAGKIQPCRMGSDWSSQNDFPPDFVENEAWNFRVVMQFWMEGTTVMVEGTTVMVGGTPVMVDLINAELADDVRSFEWVVQ